MNERSPHPDPPQEIRFCRAPDGVRIAYARHGSGPVLVINTCWLSHLQFDWESPVWRHFLDAFGRFATVIRYDERGHGLSDWDVDDFGLEARIGDLEAVVDDAGLERFALMGMAQGGPPAIAYTARHPERVSRLMFYGSYGATMPDPTDEQLELASAFDQMVKVGWARPESAFRRVFTSLMIPGATEEQKRWLDDLQRAAVSAENAYRSRRERAKSDVRTLLPELRLPTLVLHSRGDQMNDFDASRYLAAHIEGAQLVALDSRNHIVLADEPAWPVLRDAVEAFMAPEKPAEPPGPANRAVQPAEVLSPRELEVLQLAAEGLDNDAIAERLTLSARTIERHFSNIYDKLDIHGRSARTAAVARLLTPA